MTVTAIRSRSAGSRRFAVGSTSLSVVCRTRGRGPRTETTVSVAGEIDSVNAGEFARMVREAVGVCAGMILDLTEIDFMAVDGVSALHAVNAHLLRTDVDWCVVASPPVTRVLDLCDPEGLIPLARVPSLRSAATA
ncbi:MAG: STAS domain-containing protein [Actinomycetota bacterium]|nr:STAS domain-containing protein [Actinomycetota bacterium]